MPGKNTSKRYYGQINSIGGWGTAYKKPEFIAALKAITGERVAVNISDAKLIEKVNALSDEQEEALKAAVESAKATA